MDKNEAIEVLKKYQYDPEVREALECLHPELKESEDERIRKGLINYFNDFSLPTFGGLGPKKIIAWLEKQGQHKPVISDEAIREGVAHFGITQYQISNWLKKYIDIEKQGSQNLANSAKTCKDEPKFKVGDTIHEIGERHIFPMVIEKIEDGDYVCDNGSSFINIEFQDKYELVKQNPAWSEDDERSIRDSIFYLDSAKKYFEKDDNILWDEKWFNSCVDWLKSLKERVQPQHQQEWSEDDEKTTQRIVDTIMKYAISPHSIINGDKPNLEYAKEFESWLKSLKFRIQPQWKPSDEQMGALDDVISSRDVKYNILSELWKELKKLKG